MLGFKHMPKVKVKHMVKCFLEWRLSWFKALYGNVWHFWGNL